MDMCAEVINEVTEKEHLGTGSETEQAFVQQLFSFIEHSPSAYHAVDTMRERLEKEGYERLLESREWKLQEGGKYFVIRGGSSLLAFRIPKKDYHGYQIVAAHSDSPSFKVKTNPEMLVEEHYVKLNVERYGGMLCAPWFDRPLSVAGRVMIREEEGKIVSRLVNLDRDLLMIPNLAIHMNREANDGYKFNAQKDMLPIYGSGSAKGNFMKEVAAAAEVDEEQVIGNDLFLYNRMPGTVWGADNEFISAPRLDDLQCVFASMEAFLRAKDGENVPLHAVFDNEEVGSGTRQGAASTFLQDTLLRISACMGKTGADYRRDIAGSFMLSADNAHAVHPNYTDKACPTNRPFMNEGIVLKSSGNQKYTTDGASAAVFVEICRRANVPYQKYANRSDLPGGSTLGNIAAETVPVLSVDIGIPQLAMHSPYETAGVKDLTYMIRVMREFYGSAVYETEEGFEIR